MSIFGTGATSSDVFFGADRDRLRGADWLFGRRAEFDRDREREEPDDVQRPRKSRISRRTGSRPNRYPPKPASRIFVI